MRLLAQSPDGTLMCCASDTQLKFVDSRFLKLYETNTPGPILAACFHPQKYELFLKIHGRTVIFDLATKEYRTPEEHDTPIPQEPWIPPPPPQGAMLQHSSGGLSMQNMSMSNSDKRRSGSGRPKGSKDKTQRKARSAAAQVTPHPARVYSLRSGLGQRFHGERSGGAGGECERERVREMEDEQFLPMPIFLGREGQNQFHCPHVSGKKMLYRASMFSVGTPS